MSKAKTIKSGDKEYIPHQVYKGIVSETPFSFRGRKYHINRGNICNHKILLQRTYDNAVSAAFYRDLMYIQDFVNKNAPLIPPDQLIESLGKALLKKCTVNFPDDFYFSYYSEEIYGFHPKDSSVVFKLDDLPAARKDGELWIHPDFPSSFWPSLEQFQNCSGNVKVWKPITLTSGYCAPTRSHMKKVGFGNAIEEKKNKKEYQQKKSQDKKRKKTLSAKKSTKKKTDEKLELVNIKRKKQKEEVIQDSRNPHIETFQDTTFEKIEKFQDLIQQAKNLFDGGIYDEVNYKNAVQKYNSEMSLLF